MGNPDSWDARRAGQINPIRPRKSPGAYGIPASALTAPAGSSPHPAGQEPRRAFTAATNSSRSMGLGKYPSGAGTSLRWLMNFS